MSGGGGGSIAAMITTLKNNKNLLGKHKAFSTMKNRLKVRNAPTPDPKHISKEELEAFHQLMLREKKRDTVKRMIIALGSLLLTALLIYRVLEIFS